VGDIRFIAVTEVKVDPAGPQDKVKRSSSVADDGSDVSVSVHRAFVYSLAMPGWGESYGGSKKRALVTYSALGIALLTFFFALYKLVAAVSIYTRSFRGSSDIDLWDLFFTPGILLLLGGGGLYIVWMWAMLSSVETAAKTRKDQGLPLQRSPFWSVLMTYLCPGVGHLYIGKKEQGYILCGLSILATFLILPSLIDLSDAVKEQFMSGSSVSAQSVSSLQEIMSKMGALSTYVTLGFGAILAMVIQIYALADISCSMSEFFVVTLKKVKTRLLPVLFLIFCGYICPGSGQIMAGRKETGWFIVWTVAGIKVFVAFMIGLGLIDRTSAGTFTSIPALLGWIALFEAPGRLLFAEKMNNESTS
jgi:hypothetical protein